MKAETAATLSDAMTGWEKVMRKVAYDAFGGTRGGLDKGAPGVWLLSGSGVLGQNINMCRLTIIDQGAEIIWLQSLLKADYSTTIDLEGIFSSC